VNEVVESLVVGVRDTSALGRKKPLFDPEDLT
jgi:2-C-methyl-D-erythritol 2,4-cyclodiphosphate synthase